MDTLLFIGMAIGLGILPMVLFALSLWWLDRYEREPWPLLLAAFLWGFFPSAILAIIVGLILEIPLGLLVDPDSLSFALVSASIYAPIVEEVIKGAGLLIGFLIFRHEFDSVFDGVIYGSMVGFGFGAIENVLYFGGTGGFDELYILVFMRVALFGLNHAFYTSLTGIGFALARFQKSAFWKLAFPLLGLGAAMVAHSLHNLGVTLASVSLAGFVFSLLADWTGIFFVFVVIIVSLTREGRWIRAYLQEEVGLGTVSQAQYINLSSAVRRLGDRWGALLRGDFRRWLQLGRFQQRTSELAYKKHQIKSLGEGSEAAIARLRTEVSALGQEIAPSAAKQAPNA